MRFLIYVNKITAVIYEEIHKKFSVLAVSELI